jgi:GAF domain-containing protein
MAHAAKSTEPLRVDKARAAPEAAPFCFVSAPLRREERVVGVLAAFATLARRPFSVQDAEQVTDAAAQLAELI